MGNPRCFGRACVHPDPSEMCLDRDVLLKLGAEATVGAPVGRLGWNEDGAVNIDDEI